MPDDPSNCSVVEGIIAEYRERAAFGEIKYGAPLGRTELTHIELLKHAKYEAMDLALYLHKAIIEYEKSNG